MKHLAVLIIHWLVRQTQGDSIYHNSVALCGKNNGLFLSTIGFSKIFIVRYFTVVDVFFFIYCCLVATVYVL